jgi:predicted  nucleic acid-binding Zn-ribbon protein
MSMIPEVKCRRCGETFSSMRSRCPNCGTRRVTQSSRTPSTTPGTVRGTASYERAETNTKWQLIFGLILVVAVILAVIVMVTTSLEGMDSAQQSNTQITPPVATAYVPEIESAPTPSPTPPPQVEGIRVMFYTTEIQNEFTMRVGEVLDLTAQVMPLTLEGAKVTWTSANEDYLQIQSTGDLSATFTCVGDIAGGVKMTVSCGNFTKELTVYCRPAD